MFTCKAFLITACAAALCSSALGACPGATTGRVGGSGSVALLADKVFFRTSGLELDFDGSPNAYGVHDQGQENICAGLAPLSRPCHGKYRGACYKVCQDTFAAWSRTSGDPKSLRKSMCSVGLGGGGCSRPDVRLQDAPRGDWFVSETSLKTSPEGGPADSKWLNGQDAQLDPAAIRYLVVPGALTQAPWKIQFGDVGIAMNAARQEMIPFIVGDGGGLGEGAVSLLAALRPDKPPSLQPRLSALGDEVMRYVSGVDGDFRFVIFRNTAKRDSEARNVTSLTAAKLNDWITTTAMAALQNQSSRTEIAACSMLVPAIKK